MYVSMAGCLDGLQYSAFPCKNATTTITSYNNSNKKIEIILIVINNKDKEMHLHLLGSHLGAGRSFGVFFWDGQAGSLHNHSPGVCERCLFLLIFCFSFFL